MSRKLTNTSHVHMSFVSWAVAMRTWSDIAHTQQSENKTRSGHVAACAAHARAQLRTHDRRSAGGEAPRPIERERHQKDCCARAPSEIAVRAALDFAAPIDHCSPPLAAPRCGRTLGMSRKRPAHMGTHIPAQIEHENIVDARHERSVQAFSATKVENARPRGRRGAKRAP